MLMRTANAMPNIVICMPLSDRGGIPLRVVRALLDSKLPVLFRQGPLIEDNRAALLRDAHEQGYSLALFVDSDIVFTRRDVDMLVEKFIETKGNIVTGMYRLGTVGNPSNLLKATGDDFEPIAFQEASVIPGRVDACGLGFALVSLSLHKTSFARIEYQPGKYHGEDVSFCIRGGPVVVCPSVYVGHLRELPL